PLYLRRQLRVAKARFGDLDLQRHRRLDCHLRATTHHPRPAGDAWPELTHNRQDRAGIDLHGANYEHVVAPAEDAHAKRRPAAPTSPALDPHDVPAQHGLDVVPYSGYATTGFAAGDDMSEGGDLLAGAFESIRQVLSKGWRGKQGVEHAGSHPEEHPVRIAGPDRHHARADPAEDEIRVPGDEWA